MVENRRTSTRYVVALNGVVTIDGTSREYAISNLSVGGALIADPVGVSEKLAMGSRLHIRFTIPALEDPSDPSQHSGIGSAAHPGEAVVIEVGARVAWSDNNLAGIHFDGLRAREVWALNQYFEQLSSSTRL